jgi:hypothetical protein
VCRLLLLDGVDPLIESRRVKAARRLEQARRVPFDQRAKAYIAAHRGSWKNAKHGKQWETTLASYASPLIGALPVAEVDTDLVVQVLSPIWQTKTETAGRLRGRIESILDWAAVNKYREGRTRRAGAAILKICSRIRTSSRR